jgi:hypothetical protein
MALQEASLIGVDSLGIDVRAFSGLEVRTVRFSFNAQVVLMHKLLHGCF